MTRNLTNSALIRTMMLLLLAASAPSMGVLGAAGASTAPPVGYSSRVAGEYRTTEADRARRSKKKWKKAWIVSWVAFAAVNILDAHSSAGHIEANPLLRRADGTFSVRKAILVKALLGGGLFGAAEGSYRTRRGLEKALFQFTIFLTVVFLATSILSVRLF